MNENIAFSVENADYTPGVLGDFNENGKTNIVDAQNAYDFFRGIYNEENNNFISPAPNSSNGYANLFYDEFVTYIESIPDEIERRTFSTQCLVNMNLFGDGRTISLKHATAIQNLIHLRTIDANIPSVQIQCTEQQAKDWAYHNGLTFICSDTGAVIRCISGKKYKYSGTKVV